MGENKDERKASDLFYDAWDKFLALEPKRARKASKTARKIKDVREIVEQNQGEGLRTQCNATASYEQAAAECKAKVAAIVGECTRLNRRYCDIVFNLEDHRNSLWSLTKQFPAEDEATTPSGARRVTEIFDKPQFTVNGQAPADIIQGMVGDCWFLAALTAVTAKKELMDNLCVARDENVGVYGFVFYRDGEWIPEVIDDKLLLRYTDDDSLSVVRDFSRSKKTGVLIPGDGDKLKAHLREQGGKSLYFSYSNSNETWLPLIEKAYAKAHGDYYSIEGGWSAEGIEDLTGGVAATIKPGDIMDKDRFWREQLLRVNDQYLFGGDSSMKPSKGMVENHAYAIMRAYEGDGLRLLKIRNPWGNGEWSGDWGDGSKLWTPDMLQKLGHTFGDDGIFWMTYEDFLKHFPRINRVRLFDRGWHVSQQWTCVEVPWMVDYLDTKFQFTVDKKCSAVVVLSQPDNRYFRGLKGRIYYSMHFRVQRQDDDEGRWIVRSMHTSGGTTEYTRSVSAEIEDLEPGTYDVVFKVKAVRYSVNETNEELLKKHAMDKKEKLLRVGRSYDYAQSKGNLRGMEAAVKQRLKKQEHDAAVAKLIKTRVTNQRERERARKRAQRLKDADGVLPQQPRKRKLQIQQKVLAEAVVVTSEKPDVLVPVIDNQEPATSTITDNDAPATASPETALPPAQPGSTPKEAAANSEEAVPSPDVTTQDEEGQETDKENTSDGKSVTLSSDPAPKVGEAISTDKASTNAPTVAVKVDLNDDDFDWDSDIDGPPTPFDSDSDLKSESSSSDGDYSDSEASQRALRRRRNNIRRKQASKASAKDDLFANDPWRALCVLGLRVYCRGAEARVSVVRGDEDEC